LAGPLGRSIAQASDADAARQSSFDGSLHEIGREERERDRHIDLSNAAFVAGSNLLDTGHGASNNLINGAAPAKNSAFTSAGAELRLSKRRFALRQVRCRRAQAPGGNGKRARSMSGLMSGSTLYDTVLLLSIVAAIVVGAWLLWRI